MFCVRAARSAGSLATLCSACMLLRLRVRSRRCVLRACCYVCGFARDVLFLRACCYVCGFARDVLFLRACCYVCGFARDVLFLRACCYVCGFARDFFFCLQAARCAGSLATFTTSAGWLATCTVLKRLYFAAATGTKAGSRLSPAMGKWRTVLRLEVKVRADNSSASSSSSGVKKKKGKKKEEKKKEEKEKKKRARTKSPSAESGGEREAGSWLSRVSRV